MKPKRCRAPTYTFLKLGLGNKTDIHKMKIQAMLDNRTTRHLQSQILIYLQNGIDKNKRY